jgi:hypothetical protein
LDCNRGNNAWQAHPVEQFLGLPRQDKVVDRRGGEEKNDTNADCSAALVSKVPGWTHRRGEVLVCCY